MYFSYIVPKDSFPLKEAFPLIKKNIASLSSKSSFFLIVALNWGKDKFGSTKYLVLSIVFILLLGAFSHMIGILSGCCFITFSYSDLLTSKVFSFLYKSIVFIY